MRRFRIDHYDQHLVNQNSKCLIGAKSALSRCWVVFYQNMLNLDIFALDSNESSEQDREKSRPTLQLSKLILASHLSRVSLSATDSQPADHEDNGA